MARLNREKECIKYIWKYSQYVLQTLSFLKAEQEGQILQATMVYGLNAPLPQCIIALMHLS